MTIASQYLTAYRSGSCSARDAFRALEFYALGIAASRPAGETVRAYVSSRVAVSAVFESIRDAWREIEALERRIT